MKKTYAVMCLLLAFLWSAGTMMAQSFQASPAPSGNNWAENTKWYRIVGWESRFLSTGANYMDANGMKHNEQALDATDAGLFCFVGSSETGYKIYNKAQGPSKVMGVTGSGVEARVRFYDAATPGSDVKVNFAIIPSQMPDAVCFKIHGEANNYFNRRAPYLGLWNSASGINDPGSAFALLSPETLAPEELKDGKSFRVVTPRGVLTRNGSAWDRSVVNGHSVFKLLTLNNKTYLVQDNQGQGFFPPSGAATIDPRNEVTFRSIGNDEYQMKMGNQTYNISGGTPQFMNYASVDDGNRCTFVPVGNYDVAATHQTLMQAVSRKLTSNFESVVDGPQINEDQRSILKANVGGFANVEQRDAFWNALNGAPNTLQTGFYRLRGDVSSKYLTATAPSVQMTMTPWSEEADRKPELVFYYAGGKLTALNNGYRVYETRTIGALGKSDNVTITASQNAATNFITCTKNEDSSYARRLYDDNNGKADRDDATKVSDRLHWIVECVRQIPVVVGTIGKATICLPVEVTVPAGYKVYTASGSTTLTIQLAEITDRVVPANTPVVIEGAAATILLDITQTGKSPITDNLFVGTTETVAQQANTNTTTYALTANGTEAVMGALAPGVNKRGFRAYFQRNATAAQAFNFDFGNTVTAIETATQVATDAPCYDLSGRRVQRTVKGGIYLQNGQKFIQQ